MIASDRRGDASREHQAQIQREVKELGTDQALYLPLPPAPVAQWTEHPPSKRQVAGSNPAWGTSGGLQIWLDHGAGLD